MTAATDQVWYTTSSREKINWGTAISGGVATTTIYRLRIRAHSTAQEFAVYARPGTPIHAVLLAQLQAEQNAAPVPAPATPAKPVSIADRLDEMEGRGGGLAPLHSPAFTGTATINGVPLEDVADDPGILLIETAADLPPGTRAGTIVVVKA